MKRMFSLVALIFLVAVPCSAMSWKEHYDFGCQLFENGNRELAWRHFWDALAIAKKQDKAKQIARTCTQLGDLQYSDGLQGKAYSFYSQARKAWERELDIKKIYSAWRAPKKSWLGLKLKHNEVKDWVDYESVLSKLSELALKLNKKKLAARIAIKHMNIKEIRLGKNSEEYGWALSTYAKTLFDCDYLEQSESAYRKALSTIKNRAHSAQIAQIQKELATVLRARGKELDADELEKKAKKNLSFEVVWGMKQNTPFAVVPPKGIDLERPLSPAIYYEIPQETMGGSVTFSPDGKFIATYSGGKRGAIHFWSVRTKRWQGGIALPNSSVASLMYSIDGRQLYAGTTDGVRRWELKGKLEQTPLKISGNNFVFSMAQSKSGNFLAVANSTEVGTKPFTLVWSTKSGKLLRRLEGHRSSVTTIACSESEEVLATGGSDGHIMIWSLLNGKLLHNLNGRNGTIIKLCFLTEELYSTADKGEISCWNWRKGILLSKLPAQGEKLQTMCPLPHKRLLLTGGYDFKIRLWDLKKKKVQRIFQDHGGTVWHLAASPNEKLFASFGMDSRVLVWQLD